MIAGDAIVLEFLENWAGLDISVAFVVINLTSVITYPSVSSKYGYCPGIVQL